MHRKLSVHSDSQRAGSHREGRGHQQTSEIKLTLQRLTTSSDYSRDTCNASLTSKPGEVVGSVDELDAGF